MMNNVQKVIGIWAGRFQPYHPGHHSVYEHLSALVGKQNTFIATSAKTGPDSPLTFEEKKLVMSSLYGIPSNRVVQVKSPFRPIEVYEQFDSQTTAYITALSEKDEGRLAEGKYYQQFSFGMQLEAYANHGYYIVAPVFGNISGTQIREAFANPNLSVQSKKKLMERVYGKFDENIFALYLKRFKS